ncbi:hypothetical protein [Endozoicomonas sp. SESOKO1]|uniref:hypothetical protein n=1 Tax=Endozoicomonas sp. SESOKO1 TaxID=2828742 RepID=UPI002148A47E|nr:hypothetical protein [Endozoicomonas sp. SESOKO1]
MHSSVGASASNLYTQQSQSLDTSSAKKSEPEVSKSLEALLPPPDPFSSERGPDDKKMTDRAIHSQSEGDVRPALASVENMSILDSLSHIATTLPAAISAYDSGISNSEPENKPLDLPTPQPEPLPEANPEAKATESNDAAKSVSAGEATVLTGSDPEKEKASGTNETPEVSVKPPKASEADRQNDRSRTSAVLDLFRNCCGIRDRRASHPPARPDA